MNIKKVLTLNTKYFTSLFHSIHTWDRFEYRDWCYYYKTFRIDANGLGPGGKRSWKNIEECVSEKLKGLKENATGSSVAFQENVQRR